MDLKELSPRYAASLCGVSESLRNCAVAVEDLEREVRRQGGNVGIYSSLLEQIRMAMATADAAKRI